MNGPTPQPPPQFGPPTSEQRNWAMLAHLSGLLFAIPFGNIIGPLLIWQLKRTELGEFVGASAREALNFQFTFVTLIAFCVSLWFVPVEAGAIGLVLIPVVVLLNVVMVVNATVQTNQGEIYRYPFAIRVF